MAYGELTANMEPCDGACGHFTPAVDEDEYEELDGVVVAVADAMRCHIMEEMECAK